MVTTLSVFGRPLLAKFVKAGPGRAGQLRDSLIRAKNLVRNKKMANFKNSINLLQRIFDVIFLKMLS